MSTEAECRIVRDVDAVWDFMSNPEVFAKVFMGVSEVDSVKGGPEQVAMKGEIAGRRFSSSVIVEAKHEEKREITYRSGQTRIEIGLMPADGETILNLSIYAPMQDAFVLDLYADSLKYRIKEMLEG